MVGTATDLLRQLIYSAFGDRGKHYLTSGSVTGSFYAIKAIEAAVFTPTEVGATGASLASLPLAAGDIYYGRITACTLISGKIILYKS